MAGKFEEDFGSLRAPTVERQTMPLVHKMEAVHRLEVVAEGWL